MMHDGASHHATGLQHTAAWRSVASGGALPFFLFPCRFIFDSGANAGQMTGKEYGQMGLSFFF